MGQAATSYGPVEQHVAGGARLGPCGSWFTDLWPSWSNLAATDPRTPWASAPSPPEGRGSTLLSFPNNPFVCAGVWDQKEWAEDSKGLGVPIWASVAPKLDRTSMQGTLPLAPTDLVPGTSRAIEAQLQPVCPLWVCSWPKVQREVWGTPTWVPGCALGPLRSTNAAPWP